MSLLASPTGFGKTVAADEARVRFTTSSVVSVSSVRASNGAGHSLDQGRGDLSV